MQRTKPQSGSRKLSLKLLASMACAIAAPATAATPPASSAGLRAQEASRPVQGGDERPANSHRAAEPAESSRPEAASRQVAIGRLAVAAGISIRNNPGIF